MEHSMPNLPQRELAGEDNEYELEQALQVAERRYALARERSQKVRDECHALEAEQGAHERLVVQARERYAAAEAKCRKLKSLIDQLEERLR